MIGIKRRLFLLCAVVFVLSGCKVDLKEGVYACDIGGPRRCPPGWVCSFRPGDNEPRCYQTAISTCGNGIRERGEECDGEDFGLRTCLTELGLSQGTLRCTDDCTVDRSGCYECGNGVLEGPEDCDGIAMGGEDCFTVVGKESGELSCNQDCTFDTSDCHTCGDGLVEGPEECDGDDLTGMTCEDFGFDGGALSCDDNCMFDTEGCFACGNGLCEREKGENRVNCPLDCSWETVSAGGSHTCGMIVDGGVWCWGSNDYGQLGVADVTGGATPLAVTGLDHPALKVAAGAKHTCALLEDETVWCWGDNQHGQLGDGTITGSATPVALIGLPDLAFDIGVGDDYSCAVTVDSELYCWGKNGSGQLGDGETIDSTLPVRSLVYDEIGRFSPGRNHACAVTKEHDLWCWGSNASAQLGTGDTQNVASPVEATALAAAMAPEDATPLGVAAGDAHTCSLLETGKVWCWGRNLDGQTGNSGLVDPQDVPSEVTGLSDAITVEAGFSYTCALEGNGEIWCWGSNNNGRLGNGNETVAGSYTPLRVKGLEQAAVLSAGFRHACSMLEDKTMWCWGQNSLGQLGLGSTDTQSATPVRVVEP